MNDLRLPAEWEDHRGVLMAWPHAETDWAYMLDDARRCFAEIVRAVSEFENVLLVGPAPLCSESIEECGFNPDRVAFADVPTNDTWARDFGPVTVVTPDGGKKALDFMFNAWGMKFAADKDNLVNSSLSELGLLGDAVRVNRLGFVLEGGSIESDGRGTLLTTSRCLLSPNRNGQLSEDEIRSFLADNLGFTHQLWLRHGAMAGDDTDSHIDTLARLAPHDIILYVGDTTPDGTETVEELTLMREELLALRTPDGYPYNLIELPLPAPVYDENGMQLPATYANYLVTPRAVFLPVYAQPAPDRLASQILRIAYPDREIVPVDCRALIRQHGSLHCVTMQLL